METIKPKNKKHLRELYFNPALTIVFIILFVLNIFEIVVISSNFNLNILFQIVLVILIVIFFVKSIVNLFYSIDISEDIITFNTPFNIYKKRVVFAIIDDFRFKTDKVLDDNLVFFLSTGEVISVGVRRYSRDQKKYLVQVIEQRANI